MKQRYRPYTISFGMAVSIVAVLNALLTYLKERYTLVHDLMVNLTGHHWVTHSLIDLLLFFVIGVLFQKNMFQKINLNVVLLWSILISLGILVMVYLPI